MNLNIDSVKINFMYFISIKCVAFVLLLLTSATAAAQFSITATTTPETCDGNGTITITPTGTTPGLNITYIVYYGNDATGTVVHNGIANAISGQQSGNYYIEAQEKAGNTIINTATTSTVVADETQPIQFNVIRTSVVCGIDGVMEVQVTQGTAATYMLTNVATGTQIGPQTSATFTGLVPAQYSVFVYDGCGNGTSQVINLNTAIPSMEIGVQKFPDIELIECNLLTIGNDVLSTNNAPLAYPISIEFKVTAPDGTVTVYNEIITNGQPFSCQPTTVVPYYYGVDYYYDIKITDRCGTTLQRNDLLIDPVLTVFAEVKNIECSGKKIEVVAAKFKGPFTLNFPNWPAGSSPADFNENYPGPYTLDDLPIVFGGPGNPLPALDDFSYEITILDACGRTAENNFEIPIPDIEITVIPYAATCTGNGSIEGSIPGLPIGKAEIIAPSSPDYSSTYPVDVSQYIQNIQNKLRDKVVAPNFPPGEYTMQLTDTCGVVYPPKTVTVAPYNGENTNTFTRADCKPGFGTIHITGAVLDVALVTAAPDGAFPSLPYDITVFKSDDDFIYIDNLPPGFYEFEGSNECDSDITVNPATVTAYNVLLNEFEILPNCGSFEIFFNHESSSVAFPKFGLQQLDEATGQWKHPDTGELYTEGTEIIFDVGQTTNPTALNLVNNTTTVDLIYPTGTYRIVKQFVSFGDGSKGEKVKYCVETLHEFDYYSDLFIEGAVSLDCLGSSGAVQIQAYGVPPLQYKIIEKDNAPFVIDNGDNNIFTVLESGVYTVEVTDECSVKTLTFNIAEIPSLVNTPDPDTLWNLEACNDGNDFAVFDISGYESIILNGQDPSKVKISFYTSFEDAESNTNPIQNLTAYKTKSVTIYARATHVSNPGCLSITYFNLIVRPATDLEMKDLWGACLGDAALVTADPGYIRYVWTDSSGTVLQDGSLNEISTSEEGTYTVVVTDSFNCQGSKTFEVKISLPPKILNVTVDDWTETNNYLTVVVEEEGAFEYSLDNLNYQDSPQFTGLLPGEYNVYVRDKFDCGNDEWETYILTYPKFFTPNGDNINEFWRIKFSVLEPDMLVYVYDRYGKLILGFDGKSVGWDGTLNGKRLPATDYWFVVKRSNGKELKGHFSLVR